MRHESPTERDGPAIEWDAQPALRQIAMAGWFSSFADKHDDLDLVAHEVCKVAAVGLRVRFAGLLQFRADQQVFVLQAGTGWQGADAGWVRQAADLTTTTGLAWHTGQLLHFRDLRFCGRVRAVGPMRTRGVQSVLSVPIRGVGEGFGVLEVGSAEARDFARHDRLFLQALADRIAAAVGQQTTNPPT